MISVVKRRIVIFSLSGDVIVYIVYMFFTFISSAIDPYIKFIVCTLSSGST